MTRDSTRRTIAGRKLGDFTIEAELGRGGMGVVYRARQESMGRTVALKTLPSFVGMDHDAVARFRREAEAAGRLSHPGIVPIFGVGEAEGIHYYAMELVEGPSLASLIESLADREPERLLGTIAEECEGISDAATQSMSLSGARYAFSCAAIAADLASALTTAHRGMVIHRDIKPSNVLVRESGRPVLVDFGLARDEMTMGLTQSGDALGTPAYMAPEQACGRSDLDARVDIYGLGALLYEMLTLRPPFDGAHAGEIMRKIIEQDPIPVRHLNPRVPADLEKIVHTCLAKDPDDRYAAAEALEMDLRSFLEGREVVARKPRVIDRLRRVVRRDRRAFLVGLCVMVVSLLAFGVVGVVTTERTHRDGMAALRQAVEFGKAGSIKAAQQAYGRALALLSEEDVRVARDEHLPAVFAALYEESEFAKLREYLNTWSPAERGTAWLAFDTKLRGRGKLAVAGTTTATVALRRLGDDLEPWQPVGPDEQIPIGDVLVRVTQPGLSDVVQRVEIERDKTAAVEPIQVATEDVPTGFVLVPDPNRRRASFVSRTELSRDEYARFLASVDDPALREELTPGRWDEQQAALDLPVTNLTFAQARTAAALLGCHVLAEDEFHLAATGGLDELRYPWGQRFDPDAVAANRNRMNEPKSVNSSIEGMSPYGILNLVGNVGEILSPGLDSWEVPVAGGDYLSEQDQLLCSSRTWFRDQLLDQSGRLAGVRFGKFVPVPTPAAVQGGVDRTIEEMFGTGYPAVMHDWIVRANGTSRVELRLLGNHPEERDRLRKNLTTAGFAQVGELDVRDGHGRPLPATRVVSSFGDVSEFVVAFPRKARPGQQYRIRIASELEPRSALTGRADSYSLHVPLAVLGRIRCMTRVRLPSDARVESVEPRPTAMYQDGGQPVLVWSFVEEQVGTLAVPAVVRFRRDGAMAPRWPLRSAIQDVIARFVEAVKRGDRDELEGVLAPMFRQFPHHRHREKTIQAYTGRNRVESILGFDLIDAVPVGDIVTTWVRFDWQTTLRTGEPYELQEWPMRVLLQAGEDGAYRLLEIAPAGRADSGEIDDGTYRNRDLWVQFTPADDWVVHLRRLSGHMSEMQLRCSPKIDEDVDVPPERRFDEVSFTIYGLTAPPEFEPVDMHHRLTDGAWSMLRGNALDGGRAGGFLGSLEYASKTKEYEWMFAAEGGRYSRERWTVLQLGRRWFLGLARARSSSEQAADELFRKHGDFFDAMAGSLSVRDEGFGDG